MTQRRAELVAEQQALREQRAELARHNHLHQRLAGFAQRVAATLDNLDFEDRQRLLRLLVEKVAVSGWRVEIHLKIPLPDDSPEDPRPREPLPAPRRQAITACVPLVTLKGKSYRLCERGLDVTPAAQAPSLCHSA